MQPQTLILLFAVVAYGTSTNIPKPTTTDVSNTQIPLTTTPATTTTISKLECSTTTLSSTSSCFSTLGRTISCTPTSTPISFCKPSNVCFRDNNNEAQCKIRDNTVAPAGIALAVIVPSVIAIIVIYLIVSHFKNKRAKSRAKSVRAQDEVITGDSLPSERSSDVEERSYEEEKRGSMFDEVPLLLVTPPPAYSENESQDRIDESRR